MPPEPTDMFSNSAANCSILLKFGTDFDHVTTGLLQTFKGTCQGQGQSVKRRLIANLLVAFRKSGHGI